MIAQRIRVVVPVLMMGVLYWSSSIPGTPVTDSPDLFGLFYWMPPALQNTLHLPVYAALAWAWQWSLRAWLRSTSAVISLGATISVAYGFFDEWHQSFVPERYASLADVLFNAVGVVVGSWLAAWMYKHSVSRHVGHAR